MHIYTSVDACLPWFATEGVSVTKYRAALPVPESGRGFLEAGSQQARERERSRPSYRSSLCPGKQGSKAKQREGESASEPRGWGELEAAKPGGEGTWLWPAGQKRLQMTRDREREGGRREREGRGEGERERERWCAGPPSQQGSKMVRDKNRARETGTEGLHAFVCICAFTLSRCDCASHITISKHW